MKWLIVISLYVMASTAWSQASKRSTSEELLRECNIAVRFMDGDRTAISGEVGVCLGYLQGVRDGLDLAIDYGHVVCVPNEVTNGQLARVIVKHLQEVPQNLHKNRRDEVHAALKKFYPCPR